MFSAKQYIVMILAFPIHYPGSSFTNPTVRQIKEALKFYMGINLTVRHVRRLLSELDQEGIIRRDFNYLYFGPDGCQGQASSYRVVDFKGVFQNLFSFKESFNRVRARDKKRIKIRKFKGREISN